jgi:hypothetical protein
MALANILGEDLQEVHEAPRAPCVLLYSISTSEVHDIFSLFIDLLHF